MASKKAQSKKSDVKARRAGVAERRELFSLAYVANGRNATKAAKDAGFSEATAFAQGYKLLREPGVIERIAVLTAEQQQEHKMTAESVLEQLAAIVHFDVRKVYRPDGSLKDASELDDATAYAISSIEVDTETEYDAKGEKSAGKTVTATTKVKIFDKNSALDKAMRHFGLLPKDGALQVKADNVFICKELADCG